MARFAPIDMRERIESKFVPEPNSGCFLWHGALNAQGYALLAITVRPGHHVLRRVQRLYYEMEKGPIPAGLVLDHLCRVRCCVNPDHLEPITRGENAARGVPYRPDGWHRAVEEGRWGKRETRVVLSAKERQRIRQAQPGYKEKFNAWRRAHRAKRRLSV